MVRPNRRGFGGLSSPEHLLRATAPGGSARRRGSTAIVVSGFKFEDNFCWVRSDPVPDLKITPCDVAAPRAWRKRERPMWGCTVHQRTGDGERFWALTKNSMIYFLMNDAGEQHTGPSPTSTPAGSASAAELPRARAVTSMTPSSLWLRQQGRPRPINLSYNPEHHERVKHVERRHFFIRECVENGQLTVPYVNTVDNLGG